MSIRFSAVLLAMLVSRSLAAESVPFDMCAESTTWVRPSLQMQQTKVWNNARYKGFGPDSYVWTHNFLVIDDFQSVSVTVTLTNLAGLWTVKPLWVQKCYIDQRRNGAAWIEVWSLLHRVKEIQNDGNTYTVVVEPSGKGFQWIFIRRLNPTLAVIRFVTPDGKELERWDESAPPNRVKNEVPPGTRIIGPNREIIRK